MNIRGIVNSKILELYAKIVKFINWGSSNLQSITFILLMFCILYIAKEQHHITILKNQISEINNQVLENSSYISSDEMKIDNNENNMQEINNEIEEIKIELSNKKDDDDDDNSYTYNPNASYSPFFSKKQKKNFYIPKYIYKAIK